MIFINQYRVTMLNITLLNIWVSINAYIRWIDKIDKLDKRNKVKYVVSLFWKCMNQNYIKCYPKIGLEQLLDLF